MDNDEVLLTEGRRHLTDEAAAVLREARRRRGLTVRGAAALAGLSPGYLSRLENAQRAPREPAAVALIRAVSMPPDEAEQLLRECAS